MPSTTSPTISSPEPHVAKSLHELSQLARLPVALNDAAMMPLASTRHTGPIDQSRHEMLQGRPAPRSVIDTLDRSEHLRTTRAPQRIAPFEGLELGRVHIPVLAEHKQVVGHLWLIDPEMRIDADALRELQRRAGRSLATRLRRLPQLPSQTAPLPAPPAWSRAMRLSLSGGSDDAQRAFAMQAYVTSLEEALPVTRTDEAEGGDRLVQLADTADNRFLELVSSTLEARHAQLAQAAPHSPALIAAVSPTLGGDDEPALHADALNFMVRSGKDASAHDRAAHGVHVVSDDALFDLLDEMGPALASMAGWTPPSVARLMADRHGALLARTAKAFLDEGGNVVKAAERLGVHRGTLYYRLGRVEEIAGLSLDDGRHRLLLHLGLTMALTSVDGLAA